MAATSGVKESIPFEKRAAEATRILAKYPERIPVICEKAPTCTLPEIQKKKFLAPSSMLCWEFKGIVLNNIHQVQLAAGGAMSSTEVIYLLAGNKATKTGAPLAEIYENHKSDDGFLYMTYTAENTLGLRLVDRAEDGVNQVFLSRAKVLVEDEKVAPKDLKGLLAHLETMLFFLKYAKSEDLALTHKEFKKQTYPLHPAVSSYLDWAESMYRPGRELVDLSRSHSLMDSTDVTAVLQAMRAPQGSSPSGLDMFREIFYQWAVAMRKQFNLLVLPHHTQEQVNSWERFRGNLSIVAMAPEADVFFPLQEPQPFVAPPRSGWLETLYKILPIVEWLPAYSWQEHGVKESYGFGACTRRFAKYARKGIWARGPDYGQYTLDDPRIFRHQMRRQYPYHKQRQWSKPYMCLQHSKAAPEGMAVQLAIVYRSFDLAPAFYELSQNLKQRLPGVQILAEAVDDSEEKWLRVVRLNDRQLLWKPSLQDETSLEGGKLSELRKELSNQRQGTDAYLAKQEEVRAEIDRQVEDLHNMLQNSLDSIVCKALDHFNNRYAAPWIKEPPTWGDEDDMVKRIIAEINDYEEVGLEEEGLAANPQAQMAGARNGELLRQKREEAKCRTIQVAGDDSPRSEAELDKYTDASRGGSRSIWRNQTSQSERPPAPSGGRHRSSAEGRRRDGEWQGDGVLVFVFYIRAAQAQLLAQYGNLEERTHAGAIFTLLVGIVITLMGIFRLAFLVRFLSRPALSGFITASAILIMASQIKPMLGLPKSDTGGIFAIALSHPRDFQDVRLPTVAMSLCALTYLSVIKKLKSLHWTLRLLGDFKELTLLAFSAIFATRPGDDGFCSICVDVFRFRSR
ncbi:ATG8CL [Symbiodinium sp. KB8]|nr:ATG8CL [Symbiodinium sp. KB8]